MCNQNNLSNYHTKICIKNLHILFTSFSVKHLMWLTYKHQIPWPGTFGRNHKKKKLLSEFTGNYVTKRSKIFPYDKQQPTGAIIYSNVSARYLCQFCFCHILAQNFKILNILIQFKNKYSARPEITHVEQQ